MVGLGIFNGCESFGRGFVGFLVVLNGMMEGVVIYGDGDNGWW